MFAPNKIKSKSVGSVKIFEIFGDFSGDFASTGSEAIKTAMKSNSKRNALFNLSGVSQIDDAGISAILKNSAALEKCAFLTKDHTIKNRIMKDGGDVANVKVVDDEFQVADYLCKELAFSDTDERLILERRHHIRLKVVMPLQFSCETEEGKKVELFAVVSNLSEGGLFAEFIQSSAEASVKRMINPFDLKFLDLKLHLSGVGVIPIRGKMIHGSALEGGIGVEFYGTDDENKVLIQEWIAKHLRSVCEVEENECSK